ncbi:hypothetical protein LEP1GSC088_4016 [Leptospira interrogans str. L1207]|nr:hypothetical protein LEP1GSC088_4016 [Leptospira interrogans str. L1207]
MAFLEEALTASKNATLEISFQQYETFLKSEISQVDSAIKQVKNCESSRRSFRSSGRDENKFQRSKF